MALSAEKDPLVAGGEQQEMASRSGNKTFFDGPFDEKFWNKVTELYSEQNVAWADALGEAHYVRLIEEASKQGKDPAVYLLVDCVNEFWKLDKPQEYKGEIYPSFEKEISNMLEIVLDKEQAELDSSDIPEGDKCSKYNSLLPADENGVKKNLLHIAAEQNLSGATKLILKRFQDLQYNKTRGGASRKYKYPIDYALAVDDDDSVKDRDEVAASLVRSMLNERVRRLFEASDPDELAEYSFQELVKRPNMKKTVIAVLDSMINPDWPYLVTDGTDSEEQERRWQTNPDLPIRYHFFYQILDQDEKGQAPKTREEDEDNEKEANLKENPSFSHRSKSGLAALSQGPHQKFAVKHPVVRVIAQRKWQAYGQNLVRKHATFYVVFLTFLSIAFITAGHASHPLKYKKVVDYVRGFSELTSLIFAVIYFLEELDQMEKERWRYWRDIFNWIDLIGLFLLFACVPLRALDVSGQWITAALTFMINFLRIFKYFCAWEEVGLYAKTLAQILMKDMKVFAAVYMVVFFAFSGGIFLSLRATGELGKVNGFVDIMLREIRGVAEGKEFADDYNGFNAFVVLLILLNMLIVIVFLMNILIAQLSERYSSAQSEASVQYDIDKIGFVTRIENSRFKRFNLRAKHYVDGDYVNDIGAISDLITVWNNCLQFEGLDDKEAQLRKAKEGWTKTGV